MALPFDDDVLQGQISSSGTTVVTAATGERILCGPLLLHNATGSSVSAVEVFIVPNGGSAGSSNRNEYFSAILSNKSERVNLTGITLRDGMALHLDAGTNNAINYTFSFTRRTN